MAETNEPRSWKKLLLPIFLGGIMVLSIFGVIIGGFGETAENPNIKEYNGIQFKRTDQGWEGGGLNTVYAPWELENENVMFSLDEIVKVPKIYLSAIPGEDLYGAGRDLYVQLKGIVQIVFACPEDAEGCEDLPLKNCDDANDAQIVIILHNAEENKVVQEGKCVVITGNGDYMTRAVDRALFAWKGVM